MRLAGNLSIWGEKSTEHIKVVDPPAHQARGAMLEGAFTTGGFGVHAVLCGRSCMSLARN